jgi:5'-phosphate synthase pdxT subunit
VVGKKRVKIGVLALQGDFAKHIESLDRLGVQAVEVRLPEELDDLDGLIIPGGESTTVGKLMTRFGIDEVIRRRVEEGMAVFGTCTGMILLAREIEGSSQHRLGLMDISVRRNAFGRQVDSFETDLDVSGIEDGPVRAIFIRAPLVIEVDGRAQVLAQLDGDRVVMVREGRCLAAAFHPELTDDTRVHEYFVAMAQEGSKER